MVAEELRPVRGEAGGASAVPPAPDKREVVADVGVVTRRKAVLAVDGIADSSTHGAAVVARRVAEAAGHGVQSSTPVVVYDDQSGMRAARAFWFLEYFGHSDVRLLDGGFKAWTAQGYDVSTAALPPPKSDCPPSP